MGMVMRFALSAAAAVLALPAAAQMVTAADAGSVLRAMQSYGLAATLTADDQGRP